MKTFILISSLTFMSALPSAFADVCDTDLDQDIDRADLRLIFNARGELATGPDDPRDSNGNGRIDLLDARICVASCTLDRCAEPVLPPDPVDPPEQDEPLYFFSGLASPSIGWQPWVSDGTSEGTIQLALINSNGSAMRPNARFTPFKGNQYFAAAEEFNQQVEFWKTDGSPQNTVKVSDIAGANIRTTLPHPCTASEKLIFTGFSEAIGFTVTYALDEQGTITLVDPEIAISCNNSANFEDGSTHGKLLFAEFVSQASRISVHESDGISIRELPNPGNALFNANRITNVGGKLFYFSGPSNNILTLYSSDADGSNRQALKSFVEINSQRSYEVDDREQMAVLNDKLYFNADDGITGFNLWESDGTVAGTRLVKDLDPLSSNTEIDFIHSLGSLLIFRANGTAQGLWVSDGTSNGTMKISDSAPIESIGGAYAANAAVANDLYFFASDGLNGEGRELWASDGTAEGTRIVKDINPNGNGYPVNLASQGSYIVFVAEGSSTEGFELWRSDGTEEGTFLLKDICPETFCSGAAQLFSD